MPIVVFFYLICASLTYTLMYKKTKDALNPVGIMSFVWFFTAGLSATLYGEGQKEWSLLTILLIFLSGIVVFILGWCFSSEKDNDLNICASYVNSTFKLLSRTSFILTFFVVGYILYSNGFNFNAIMADTEINVADKKTMNQGLNFTESRLLNWISLYLPYTALNSIFEILYSKESEKSIPYNVFVIVVSCFYSWTLLYSRGTLLVVLLGSLFLLNSKKKISVKWLMIIGVTLISLLYYLMTLRLYSESVVFSGSVNNALFNSTYYYIAYGFQNFDQIVSNGSNFEIFENTWKSLITLVGVSNITQVNLYQLQGSTVTYLGGFYDDLGIIGVVLYPAIISFLLTKLYNNQTSLKNIYNILFLSIFQRAIFVVFFGNYFIPILSIAFPYFITFFLCYVSSKVMITFPSFHFNLKMR